MKTLFIDDSLIEKFGIMYISSILKNNGHSCDLLIENKEKKILKFLNKNHFDVIAFSCIFNDLEKLNLAKKIKENFRSIIIIGGPLPTFVPEIIHEDYIDIICRGEGEYAMLDLMNALENGNNYTKIKNLWVRKNNKIYKNRLRPLIQNLDELPFPDRTLYYKYSFSRDIKLGRFISGRGCPYNCSYCHNHSLKKMYKNKGKYFRKRSVNNLIDEIKLVKKEYGIQTISFIDDIFGLDEEWLSNFLELYKEEINLPFSCNITANLVTEKKIKKMKEANCFLLRMGIETGNDFIRNSVLNRRESKKQIINAAKIIKRNNIKLLSYNMVCLPEETIENAFETINLNRIIRTDFAVCTQLKPIFRTYITEIGMKKGFLRKLKNFRDFQNYNKYFKNEHTSELINLSHAFNLIVKYPTLSKIIKRILKFHLFFTLFPILDIYNANDLIKIFKLRKALALKLFLKRFMLFKNSNFY